MTIDTTAAFVANTAIATHKINCVWQNIVFLHLVRRRSLKMCAIIPNDKQSIEHKGLSQVISRYVDQSL